MQRFYWQSQIPAWTCENLNEYQELCAMLPDGFFLRFFRLGTRLEAVGVPGWQTGAKALCLYSQSPQACKPVRRAGHRPGWQQPWWSGMHCSPSWLQGCGRHCVSHNAPVEYKRPRTCYFHQSGACWRWPIAIQNKGQNWSRLFARERVELLIELFGRCERTNICPPTCRIYFPLLHIIGRILSLLHIQPLQCTDAKNKNCFD